MQVNKTLGARNTAEGQFITACAPPTYSFLIRKCYFYFASVGTSRDIRQYSQGLTTSGLAEIETHTLSFSVYNLFS